MGFEGTNAEQAYLKYARRTHNKKMNARRNRQNKRMQGKTRREHYDDDDEDYSDEDGGEAAELVDFDDADFRTVRDP